MPYDRQKVLFVNISLSCGPETSWLPPGHRESTLPVSLILPVRLKRSAPASPVIASERNDRGNLIHFHIEFLYRSGQRGGEGGEGMIFRMAASAAHLCQVF